MTQQSPSTDEWLANFLNWLYDNDIYVYFNDDREQDGHVFLSDFAKILKDYTQLQQQLNAPERK